MRRRSWHRLAPLAAAALLVRAAPAGAAAYLPGPGEPDPPTGEVGLRADTLPARGGNGNGIRWELAPWRHAGSVSLDLRHLRLEDGTRSTLATVFNDIEFASYVWQPWFIQVRAGLGLLATTETSGGADAAPGRSNSLSATGRFSLAVFPQSRFPFELRADVGDSRTRGDTLGADYRSTRISLTQSYRPETGSDSYTIGYDHSRLEALRGGTDTVDTLRASAQRQWVDHGVEVDATWTANDRSDTGDRSRIAALNARHAWHPAAELTVDSLASWNDVRFASRAATVDSASSIRQLSSVFTWRPREGEWGWAPDAPLTVSGSARWVDADASAGEQSARSQAVNATLGATKELYRTVRLSASVSASVLDNDGARSTSGVGSGSATWTPEGLRAGEWRWSPSIGASASLARGGGAGERATLGAQAAHSLARNWTFDGGDSVSLNLSETFGALHDTLTGITARALAHSAGLFWQGGGGGGSQGFVGLSASDSRSWADGTGRFQLVNLQATRRTQLGRHASWSGSLTLQASRSDTRALDAFTGLVRDDSEGWQHAASGSLSYEHQRAFGVPRLRFTALASVDSAQLDRRAEGDADAPRERIGESVEARLDYAIGKLDARLAARWARIDGKGAGSLFARVQRRY